MTELKNVVLTVEGVSYEIANEKIKQTERNLLKKDILDAVYTDFVSAGFQAERTDDGVVLTLEPKNTTVYVSIDAVVKNLNYDLPTAITEYELKVQKQLEREEERKQKAVERSKK